MLSNPLKVLGVSGALGLAALAPANAASTNVILGIDGSSSIFPGDFDLQKDAYANLLSGVRTDGSLAIGVLQFSTAVQTEFALQTISSEADRTALTDAISGMTQLNSLTAIGDTIDAGASALNAFADCADDAIDCLIDISTDGVNTSGGNPVAAANSAVSAGIDQVNCIGIGGFADCGFTAGTGSFSEFATDFGAFEDALETKLAREQVIDPVPLPPAMAFMAAGLAGLGWFGRRKSS
jgi:hypothetical protein